MDLIPNLPNEVALECLTRVSHKQFPTISSVCKSWNSEILLPEFRRYREHAGRTEQLLVMTQARVDQSRNSGVAKRFANPVYRVSVLELGSGHWSELPPIPGFPDGLPLFCQLSAVGSDLVVMGGLDTSKWEVLSSVFVFNFITATWRRGADMPGKRRMLFGCASDGDRAVYAAGGHDENKNALKSAIKYDVERDEWASLPDMSKERDECRGLFHHGRFHVIGGYSTDAQGRFERHAEAFADTAQRWGPVEEDVLGAATCPRTCTYDDNVASMLYMCHGGDVMAVQSGSNTWQAVAKLPTDACHVSSMTAWQGKLLVIGSSGFGEAHVTYVLDLESYKWTKIETPEEFSGHVQSYCYLEI